MASTEFVYLTAQCLCKANTVTTPVPTSSLPLDVSYCHCNSCRHLTGGMHASSSTWLGPASAINALSLREYDFTQRYTILFCSTCSSAMFWRHNGENGGYEFKVFTGVLSNNPVPNLFQVKCNIFVGDTLDGGAAVWLQHLTNNETETPIPSYRASDDESGLLDPRAMAAARKTEMENAVVPDEIPLHCRCKGVDLVLRRGIADHSAMEPSKLPFFVDPETHKLLASFDACNSCRTSAGIDIINWAFALLQHIDFAESSPSDSSSASQFPRSTPDLEAAVSSPDRDPRLGTLAYYASSDDVQRYFCSRCSASVFYAVNSRPNMVDVATGLLDAPDGARAESVLSWALGMMNWADDVQGGWRKELVGAIKMNAEDWRVKSGVPVNWARKMREAMMAKKT